MGTAQKIKVMNSFQGDASLYQINPPLEYGMRNENGTHATTAYVIASAVDAMYTGPETYLFPADQDGNVLEWVELAGSYRGGYDHAKALDGAGYAIQS